MFTDVKDVFAKHIKVNIDRGLLTNITKFRLSWISKDDSYIDFLGTNLVGVHTIRFSIKDDALFLNNVVKADEDNIRYDLYNTKGIDKAWKVGSNPIYHTIVYLMYKFATSKLNRNDIQTAIKELYYIFSYKAISSLYAHYFPFPIEPAIAKAVNEKLSNKFILKKLGSWQKLLEYRAEDILPKGLHYDRLINLDTDSAVRIVTDLQSRLRDVIKNIYPTIVEIREKQDKIVTSSLLEEGEDGIGVVDISNGYISMANYIKSIRSNFLDFYKEDIAHVVLHCFNSIKEEQLRNNISYIVENNIKDIDKILDNTVESAVRYLRTKSITDKYNSHILDIVTYLKAYYSQSSVKDKDVLAVKKFMLTVTKKNVKLVNSFTLSNITVCTITYIAVRALLGRV